MSYFSAAHFFFKEENFRCFILFGNCGMTGVGLDSAVRARWWLCVQGLPPANARMCECPGGWLSPCPVGWAMPSRHPQLDTVGRLGWVFCAARGWGKQDAESIGTSHFCARVHQGHIAHFPGWACAGHLGSRAWCSSAQPSPNLPECLPELLEWARGSAVPIRAQRTHREHIFLAILEIVPLCWDMELSPPMVSHLVALNSPCYM